VQQFAAALQQQHRLPIRRISGNKEVVMSLQALDVMPLHQTYRSMAEANRAIMDQLNGHIDIDLATGETKIDTAALSKIAPPGSPAAAFVANVAKVAEQGFFVSGTGENAFAVPWAALANALQVMQGTPKALRAALGVDGATDPTDALKRVTSRFALPRGLAANEALGQLLARDPLGGSTSPHHGHQIWLAGPGKDPGGNDGAHPSGAPTPTLNPDDVMAAARCLINGNWTSYFRGWRWSWLCGASVTLGHDCAQKVSSLLASFGGGSALLTLVTALAAGPQAPVTITVAMVLEIYAYALSWNIRLTDNGHGVVLHFWWPYPPPLPCAPPWASPA
jgi:hypothetical protein